MRPSGPPQLEQLLPQGDRSAPDRARNATRREHGLRSRRALDLSQHAGSAAGALPSAGECLDAIASHPPEIAVAFLVQEYFADDHYQAWKIQERIALVLATGSYGAAPLAIYEDYLRVQYPMTRPDSPYAQIVRESQRLLGDDFDRWYRSLRGKSYRRATWRR